MSLPVGKLDAELLAGLLAQAPAPDERVILGPGIGRDVAVLDMGSRCLVAKTDPITFATDHIGYYAVHVNANDIATSGARPLWFLGTLLLPETEATADLARDIFGQIIQACTGMGVQLVGGHTEVTYGLDRPILVGQMLGEVSREDLVTPDGLRPGDSILLTKRLGIEAASIIAREKSEDLLRRGFPGEFIAAAQAMLFEPGISVLKEAQLACAVAKSSGGHVHAMHDPTEGGVATGLWELAQAAGVGLEVWGEKLPEDPRARRLADAYELDLWGVIASGALLIGVCPSLAEPIRQELEGQGIPCTEIARATVPEAGVLVVRDGRREELPRYDQDEIGKLFA